MNLDKEIEKHRYDKRSKSATKIFKKKGITVQTALGVDTISNPLRTPYYYYISKINKYIKNKDKVLEIGSGVGEFTDILLNTKANIVASDISFYSLNLLKLRMKSRSNLNSVVLDIEKLPFCDDKFDYVVSSGVLSYGDNQEVMDEILRILRKGGMFICVDSLNNNIIYKFNRWLHFKMGRRSRSTLKRMPTINLIKKYKDLFGQIEVKYFGSISWITPIFIRLVGPSNSKLISDKFDDLFNIRNSAFKFVMIAKKK